MQWTRVAAVAALVTVLTLLPFRAGFAGSVQALAPVTDADGRLGLADVLPGAVPNSAGTTWAQLAANAGARTNRWEFRWDAIEPQAGRWSFQAADSDVSSSRQSGLSVLGVIDGTPKWGAAAGQPPGNGVPSGIWKPVTNRHNLWAAFIRGLVTHYSGEVSYWEIWNEPDLSFFWHGSATDYYRLLKVADIVIKSVDPQARVLMAGMVAPDMGFVTQVLQAAERDTSHSRAFDIAAWHAYGPAVALFTNLHRFRALLTEHGFGSVPLWVTEDGFPAANPAGEPRQAAYVLQTIVYALAAGADKILVYRASDDTTGKKWGLLTGIGTPRMGYVAFQVAAQYLAHAQAITYAPAPHLERFVFYEPDRRVTVEWTHGLWNRPVDVLAGQPTSTVVDWTGVANILTPVGGSLSLHASGATYNAGIDPAGSVVGGPPLFEIESNAAPAGLPARSYVPPLGGSQRRLVLFNPSDATVPVQVAVNGNPIENEVVSVAANSLASVDLDLLGGAAYQGVYTLSAAATIDAEAGSSQATLEDQQTSTSWYLPYAPTALTLRSGSAGAASVSIVGYDSSGRRRAHTTVSVPATGSTAWQAKWAKAGHPLSLVLQSTDPIAVSASDQTPVRGAALPSPSWYVVGPLSSRLVMFNPAAKVAHISVHFVGAPEVKAEQIYLKGHHSFVLGTQGGRAVAATSKSAIVLDYHGAGQAVPTLQGQPSTRSSLAATGGTTAVTVFNPGKLPAHVALSLVTPSGVTVVDHVINPSQVYTLQARQSAGPPTGVNISSDVPVVSQPGQ